MSCHLIKVIRIGINTSSTSILFHHVISANSNDKFIQAMHKLPTCCYPIVVGALLRTVLRK